MEDVGQPPCALIPAEDARFAIAALVVAAAAAAWLWPFTIDDAGIPIRYARHLVSSGRYAWNLGGAATDGVTPLPWTFILAPLARATPEVVLVRAKALGLALWLVTATAWGAKVGRADAPRGAKLLALAGLGVSVPLAAHAVSGMETPLATSLVTWAALSHARPTRAALLAGLAASFRPELLPWALTLAALLPPDGARRVVAIARGALLAALPFAMCVVLRLVAFGSPVPLSLLAKPSDLAHGAAYVVAAALVSVGPVLAFAPVAAARERGPGRALLVAGLVHLGAVAAVGGDWMPFARLVAPVVPSLLYASVLLARRTSRVCSLVRAGVALTLGLRALVFATPPARRVGPDRVALAARVARSSQGCPRVAAVDIGWLAQATEADIVDLAGVTDPEIAALPGGHTSKRVDAALLLARDPGALVLYAAASGRPLAAFKDATFPRVIEARLAASDLVAAHFAPVAWVPLGATGMGYYVLARSP